MKTGSGMVIALSVVIGWTIPAAAQGGFSIVASLAYFVTENQTSELAVTLARVERATASTEWSASQQAWTPVMLQKAAALLGEAKRGEQVARGWHDGRALTWTAKNRPDCQVAVAIIRFRDAADARAYMGLAVDLQRRQDELLSGDGNRVIDSRSSASPLGGAEETARCDRRLQLPGSTAAVSVSQVWARADNRIVEFTWNGTAPDVNWAQQVFDVIGNGIR
jgi:hypothetical protein